MATQPKVSVIIPAFNAQSFIAEAVVSVLHQSFTDLECIVINDGSTDGTLEALEQFGNQIRVLSQENQGVSRARNCGISVARGEWLAFLDADDIWHENKLKVQFDELKNRRDIKLHSTNLSLERSHLTALDYFDMIKMPQPSASFVLENPAVDLLRFHFPWLQTTLVHKSLINHIGDLFNPQISLYEDFEWMLKLSFKSPWMISRQVLVDIKRRNNEDVCLSSARSKNELKAAEIMLEILKAQYQRLPHPQMQVLAEPLGRQHSYVGNVYKAQGDKQMARMHYREGLRKDKSVKLLIKYLLSGL